MNKLQCINSYRQIRKLQTLVNQFEIFHFIGIDTDKHKYPIGSARVTFDNNCSYINAVSAAFIDIKTAKFSKKVNILVRFELLKMNCFLSSLEIMIIFLCFYCRFRLIPTSKTPSVRCARCNKDPTFVENW